MKKTISIKRKSIIYEIIGNVRESAFVVYCFLHTLFNYPKQLFKVYWSNSDCYIEIGKSGYISKSKIFDLNGDVTNIRELVIGESNPLKISLSEPELNRIKELAQTKHLSVKDLLLYAIDKIQTEK